ncbi:MAG TPA: DNA polymerase III subunit gamma/tau, partial [Verrucomicrobiae bacterium]|nr:DNA polymerase III subunit gamma/tau [Verrucomicrobiae bacterium]
MSNLVLYRKYRPTTFKEVVSQSHVKTTLANAVANGRIGHAYLFTGPRGVGKTTIARVLARAVNCLNMSNGEPCNQCDMCKDIMTNTNLDLMEIDAASHTGVDNIRELIDHLQFAPSKSKYKVIIIDEVHMLSKGAFNALLKTLEEPPKHAIFILATTEIHKVPATIVSRTQRFDFKKVSISDIAKLLKYVCDDVGIKITEEALTEIAIAADGGFRDALSLLDQVITYVDGEVTETLVEEVLGLTGVNTLISFFEILSANKRKEAINFISELMYSGKDLFQFQKDFLEFLRKLMLVKIESTSNLEYAEDIKEKIKRLSDQTNLPFILKAIENFQIAGVDLKNSTIPTLPLELAVFKTTEDQTSGSVVEKPELSAQTESENSEGLNSIVTNWPQIMEKVKEYNHSLISSLKLAQPIMVTAKELVLAVPYKFHKDTLEARKNRIVIDQVIEEVTKLKLITKVVLSKEMTQGISATDSQDTKEVDESNPNLVESALKIMGGEVEKP